MANELPPLSAELVRNFARGELRPNKGEQAMAQQILRQHDEIAELRKDKARLIEDIQTLKIPEVAAMYSAWPDSYTTDEDGGVAPVTITIGCKFVLLADIKRLAMTIAAIDAAIPKEAPTK